MIGMLNLASFWKRMHAKRSKTAKPVTKPVTKLATNPVAKLATNPAIPTKLMLTANKTLVKLLIQ